MMKNLKFHTILNYSFIGIVLIFWPLELFLANTTKEFINYILPCLIICLSYFLYCKKSRYHLLPILILPFVQPKLALIPLSYVAIDTLLNKKLNKILLLLSIVILIIFSKTLINQSIFIKDYNSQQTIVRNSLLYPNIPLARVFQNKGRIYIDKFNDRFFSLIDPNNYFFGFQPRQIVLNNQNLDKFPFLAIIPFFIGLYYLFKNKNKNIYLTYILGSIISLSLLTNFDRHDIILWLPFTLIILSGTNYLKNKLGTKYIYFNLIFILFGLAQLIRLLVEVSIK
jgi:hypothetical protein